MADTLKIRIGTEVHEVPARTLNILCHQGDVNPTVDGTIRISPFDTQDYISKLTDEEFKALLISDSYPFIHLCFRCIFKDDIAFPTTLQDLQQQGSGVKHAFGLIMLLLTAMSENKTPHIQFPETYLHPRYQVNLADLFIFLQNPKDGLLGMFK